MLSFLTKVIPTTYILGLKLCNRLTTFFFEKLEPSLEIKIRAYILYVKCVYVYMDVCIYKK